MPNFELETCAAYKPTAPPTTAHSLPSRLSKLCNQATIRWHASHPLFCLSSCCRPVCLAQLDQHKNAAGPAACSARLVQQQWQMSGQSSPARSTGLRIIPTAEELTSTVARNYPAVSTALLHCAATATKIRVNCMPHHIFTQEHWPADGTNSRRNDLYFCQKLSSGALFQQLCCTARLQLLTSDSNVCLTAFSPRPGCPPSQLSG